MTRKNLKLLFYNFDFNPADYMDVNFLLELKKTSEEKIIDRIIEKSPENDMYYIEHRGGTNSFRIRQDKKQEEEGNLFRTLTNLHKKIATSKDKAKILQLKRIRAQAKQMYEDLSEKYAEVEEEREEWLNILLKLEPKIVTTTNRLEISELEEKR